MFDYTGDCKLFEKCKFIKHNDLSFLKVEKVLSDNEVPLMLDLLDKTYDSLFHGSDYKNSGSARNSKGETLKNNLCKALYDEYKTFPIINIIRNRFFNSLKYLAKEKIVNHDSVYFQGARTNWDGCLLSYYGSDTKYDAHIDDCMLTFLSWYHYGDSPSYEGGELYLPEYDITLECEKNTGIVFPSSVLHQVKSVKIKDNSAYKYAGRISFTIFSGIQAVNT